jgi:hypothetical protein
MHRTPARLPARAPARPHARTHMVTIPPNQPYAFLRLPTHIFALAQVLPTTWDAITSIDMDTGHSPVDPSYEHVTRHKVRAPSIRLLSGIGGMVVFARPYTLKDLDSDVSTRRSHQFVARSLADVWAVLSMTFY